MLLQKLRVANSAELMCVPLLDMKGNFKFTPASVLRDDWCRLDVIYQEFAEDSREQPTLTSISIFVNHAKQGAKEIEGEMITNGTVVIRSYCYNVKWFVADCRLDGLLGMPWHAEENPSTD